jgi:hypothetical protein
MTKHEAGGRSLQELSLAAEVGWLLWKSRSQQRQFVFFLLPELTLLVFASVFERYA